MTNSQSSRSQAVDALTVLRSKDVLRAINLAKSTLHAYVLNGTFPKPMRLGPRAVGWRASDVAAWLEARAQQAAIAG